MSLDLYITIKDCKHCGQQEWIGDLNYTYNVSPMWYEIFPDDKGMVNIDGMTGKKASIKLSQAIKTLISHRDKFEKMNPENGWGSYEGFIKYLERVLEVSQEYPDGIWNSSR